MKKTRKLIPALAMLLISAVMMSTASFAWFSMNTSVKAEGMKVTAATSKNLVISTTGNESDFGFGAEFTDDTTTKLLPSSVNCATNQSLSNMSFYANETGEGVDLDTGVASESATFIKVDSSNAASYYKTYKLYVKCNTESDTDNFAQLYVSAIDVTRANSKSEMTPALRVAVTNGTHTYIYAPVSGGGYTGGKSISTIDDNGKASFDNQVITLVNDTNATLGEVTNTAKEITVYVWYEGNDSACTSKNSLEVDNLTISISFKADEEAPTV